MKFYFANYNYQSRAIIFIILRKSFSSLTILPRKKNKNETFINTSGTSFDNMFLLTGDEPNVQILSNKLIEFGVKTSESETINFSTELATYVDTGNLSSPISEYRQEEDKELQDNYSIHEKITKSIIDT